MQKNLRQKAAQHFATPEVVETKIVFTPQNFELSEATHVIVSKT